MRPYKNELRLETKSICYNGAMIVDGKNEKVIREIKLEEEYGRKIIDISRKYNVHLNIFQDEKWYVEKEREEVIFYKNNSGLEYIIKNFDKFDNYNFTKTMLIDDPKKLKIVEKEVLETMGNDIYCAYSKPMYFEMLNKNISKGDALMEVLKQDKIDPKNVMAFGDGDNDFEMLDIVGVSVVMQNGSSKLKNHFVNIAPSNENSGVGKYLNKYFEL